MRGRTLMLVAFCTLGSLGLAGCGESDGTDEEFVVELCGASRELEAGIAKAVADSGSETDPAKAVEKFVAPLEAFVEAFKDADPPEDLKDWHDESGDALEASVDKFKAEKSLASLEGFGDSPVPDPPADAKARLRKAAEGVDECDGVVFLKPD